MKRITSLIWMALLLVASIPLSMRAQTTVKTYDINLEQYPTNNYSSATKKINLQEIAALLDVDTAAIANHVGKDYVYAQNPEGDWSNEATAGAPGFWLNNEGKRSAYADGFFYVEFRPSANDDLFTVQAGQYPDKCAAGNSYSSTIYMRFGEKQIQFNVTLNVVAKPVLDWDDISEELAIDLHIDHYVGSNSLRSTSTPFAPIAKALGVDAATLAGTSEVFYAKDTLGYSSNYTAYENNFWFNKEGYIATWGTTDEEGNPYFHFYVNNTIDEEEDEYSISVGLNSGALELGDECKTQVFLVYGDKMVTANITVSIVEAPLVDWTSMTLVETYKLSVSKYPSDGYNTTNVAIDLADAATKMGIEEETLVESGKIYAYDAGGDYSDNYTQLASETTPGFWFNQAGIICSWGAGVSEFYVNYQPANSLFAVGGYPDANEVGMEYLTDLFVAYGTTYVKFELTLNYIEKPDLGKPTEVAFYNFEMEVTPSPDLYPIDQTIRFDLNPIASAMGIANGQALQFYAESADGSLVDTYSCDPNPGFWLDAEGYRSTWGGSSPVGVCYSFSGESGIFTFFQYPGANAADSEFTTKVYLVDPETNQSAVFNLLIKFVEQVTEYTEVGSKMLEIALLPTDGNTHQLPIDFSALATALGVSEATLKSDDSQLTLYANTASGGKTSLMTADAGFWMTKSGIACEFGDEANAFGVEYYGIPSQATPEYNHINVSLYELFEDGDVLQGTLYLGYPIETNAVNYFAYHVKVYISNDPTGITVTAAEGKNGTIYDMQGRAVKRDATSTEGLGKGIYILNHKKYIVK